MKSRSSIFMLSFRKTFFSEKDIPFLYFFVFLFFVTFSFLLPPPSSASEQLLLCPPKQSCNCPTKTVELNANFHTSPWDLPGKVLRCYTLEKNLQNPLLASPDCLGNSPDSCDPCTNKSSPGESYYASIIKTFPKGCGYKWQGFSTSGFNETISEFLKSGKILCSSEHQSMCTSAAFLAFLMKAKQLVKDKKITQAQLERWADLRGPAWPILNIQARPDLLLKELDLGDGRILRQNEIPTDNWPSKGDLVQIWRKDRSGHSVVFSNLLKSSNGKVMGVCYWASNKSTNGYGERCEPIEKVDRLIASRFK